LAGRNSASGHTTTVSSIWNEVSGSKRQQWLQLDIFEATRVHTVPDRWNKMHPQWPELNTAVKSCSEVAGHTGETASATSSCAGSHTVKLSYEAGDGEMKNSRSPSLSK